MNSTQFLCYRHLIEKVGAHTPIGAITRRLLFIQSLDRYEDSLPQPLSDVNTLIANKMVSESAINKFIEIFGFEFKNGMVLQGESTNHKNALWMRSPFGVSTCSNHVERLHLSLNNATKNFKSKVMRLNQILIKLTKYYDNYSKRSRRQARELYSHLKEVENNPNNEIVQTKNCNCGWSEIYTCRFGIEFPCIHKVLEKEYIFPDIERPNEYDVRLSISISNAIQNWGKKEISLNTRNFLILQAWK